MSSAIVVVVFVVAVVVLEFVVRIEIIERDKEEER
jgi:hypothetical protein